MKKKYDNSLEHRSKLYCIWTAIRQRCFNNNNKDYKHYGGRGISVCEEWEEFINFKTWAVANGYKEGLSIDRIDVNGNYEPSNCRWITIQEQQRNKRNSRLITYDGESHTLSEWSRMIGIKRETLRDRIDKSGWSIEEALTTPLITDNNIKLQHKYRKRSD